MEATPLGSHYNNGTWMFFVWAPKRQSVELHLLGLDRYIPMHPEPQGYFSVTVADLKPGDKYLYRLDKEIERPDPASRYQPEGVHGPSALVSTEFEWSDASWISPPLRDSVFYELHVGTFTEEGSFEAIIPYLPELKELGITTIQLMPIAQFPGSRNWGYDGVQLFAPHSDYGGPDGLYALVNACHNHQLAIFLDVVYNHLGPEGNYLWDYGPYFTDRYSSPWGASVNLDGAYSDEVRHFFIQNAMYWLETYHFDGLRLDATHALFDFSARPFLGELSESVNQWAQQSDRYITLLAENDQSDRRVTLPLSEQGLGIDGQWLDDLHHTLHVALTGESNGYYLDYQPFPLLSKVLREGFAYSGQYSPVRKRRHGTPSEDLSTDRFIVSTQTHDQVGNRMLGERLTDLTDFNGLKLAAGLLACSPYTPMLFMGEEYGETAPFLYFISHSDESLIEAIRNGRAEEFADFEWNGVPPDPQDASTFMRCKLNRNLGNSGHHALLLSIYKDLLTLRHAYSSLRNPERSSTRVIESERSRMICMERSDEISIFRIFMNFDLQNAHSLVLDATPHLTWKKLRDSNQDSWTLTGKDASTSPSLFQPGTPMDVTLMPTSFAIYLSTL